MANRPPNVDLRVWGKSIHLPRPYPLLWHLVDTAAVAAALWDRFLTANQRRVIAGGLGVEEEHARSLIMFWAGLHDVGKATPGFQSMNKTVFEALRIDPDNDYGTDRGDQERSTPTCVGGHRERRQPGQPQRSNPSSAGRTRCARSRIFRSAEHPHARGGAPGLGYKVTKTCPSSPG
jgi:hypothetical protein